MRVISPRIENLFRVLVIAAFCSGCETYWEPLVVRPRDRLPVSAGNLSKVHVAVRRPTINDPPPPQMRGLDPKDILEFRQFDANRAIEELRATQLFGSVAYADEIQDPPSVEIEIQSPPLGDAGAILLPFLSLGVLPCVGRFDSGIYFHFENKKVPDFRCEWPYTVAVGWFPIVLLRLSESWSSAKDQEAFLYHLRTCVVDQSDPFLPANQATPEPSSSPRPPPS